jgi:signal transduction histidine kinase
VARRVERIASNDASQRTFLEMARRAPDYAAFVNDASALAAAQELDFLDLVAEDGTIISSAHWPARFGYRTDWVAGAGNRRDAFLRPVDSQHATSLGLIAVRQVSTGGQHLYLAGGRSLDHRFLRSLVLPPGTRALLYQNVGADATRQHWIDASDRLQQTAPLEPLVARVQQTALESAGTVEWPDGRESFTAIPLTGADHRVLGVLLVGTSGREVSALVSRIQWLGLGFGLLGVLAGFALSYVLAARVTRPVEQLARAADTVASGDWDVRVDQVRGTDEIERLARAFDSMTRQLAHERERLVQVERVAAWRELARRLAHELKNPLFPLRITLDNLKRAAQLDRPQFEEVFDESLTTLGTGLANLNRVVGRFSDFAKMPAPQFSTVSPNQIVHEAVALVRAQIEAPGAPATTLELDLDLSNASIRADGEQLGRAVQNLLLNAIDAMPKGGRLSIRTRHAGAMFEIDVTDTGEGLTEEERKRLFTPYYTTKQHGTGLGLAIVQSVVADHNGRIRVDSSPGRGTTFHFELPLAPAPTGSSAGL